MTSVLHRFGIAALLATGMAVASPGPARGVDACKLSALNGNYIFALTGFKTAGETAAQRTPFAQAGREFFDGKGSMNGMATASMNGAIVRLTYQGTYTINPDCSGKVTFKDSQGQQSNFDIFVTPDGSNLTYVQTDATVVSSGWERRE
jgi:hypothetical protein